jgi:hypothetical protein
MHSWGINLRYFGRVRRELHRLVYSGRESTGGSLIPNKKWEKNFRFLDSLLLTEMTTRVVKDIFHEQMRYLSTCSLLTGDGLFLTPLERKRLQKQGEEGRGSIGGALSPSSHQAVQPHHWDMLAQV